MLTQLQSILCSAWDLASSTSPRASIQPGIPRLGSIGHIATPEASSQSMLSASSISPNRHDRNAVMGKGGCLLKRERRSCVRVLEKEGFAEDLGEMADLGFEKSRAVEVAADAIEESVKEIDRSSKDAEWKWDSGDWICSGGDINEQRLVACLDEWKI
nr:hypothetical protein Iba_chr10bCG1570 [Ipomoea batatas]